MNKINRVIMAQETLDIIEKGHYMANGQTVSVQSLLEASIHATFTVAPSQWDGLLQTVAQTGTSSYQTTICVQNCTTIAALLEAKTDCKIGILNFASAKNPGGGFQSGASAQEESLSRSSGLYATLTKDMTMYRHNRAQSSFLYSDYMIYSPQVPFWMDDEGQRFDTPILADVITSPAPNLGAMLQHDRRAEINQVELVLESRMEKVLALAQQQGINYLILGAWGCGVFRNDPAMVARLFQKTIQEKFAGIFQEIVFAVYDTSDKQVNFRAFETPFQ